MSELQPPAERVLACHGTRYDYHLKIIKESFIPGEDSSWFGRGVYFFLDGVSHRGPCHDAERWCFSHGKRNYWRDWAVLQASVSTFQMLDLTVLANMRIFNEYREILYQKYSPEMRKPKSTKLDNVIIAAIREKMDVGSVKGNVYIRFVIENDKSIASAVPNVTILCVFDHKGLIDKDSITKLKEGRL